MRISRNDLKKEKHVFKCSEVTREYIDQYCSDRMRSKIGAESAWRGFMLQALYIANRVSNVDENTVFLPETVEDLLVLKHAGTSDESVELVQVKSVSSQKLTISKLKPSNKAGKINEDSFFGHLHEAWKRDLRAEAKLIVFGEVSKSLKNIRATFAPGSEVRSKFVNDYGYADKYCAWLQQHLNVEMLNENDLNDKLTEVLRGNVETQAAVRAASAYLRGKLYEACKDREQLSLARWRELLAEFGVQQASNREFQNHYGTTIVPLMEYLNDIDEDNKRAIEEYVSGSSATPKHIALNLDIDRPEWQEKIRQAFVQSNIVILRGASGQGKSTTCYRWLIGRSNLSEVYLISNITSASAPQIAACLRGLANERDIYAYVEADANEAWVSFLKEVIRVSNKHLRILVSVRNDDASRSGYDANLIESAEISLYLTKHEAQDFYNHVRAKRHNSFEDAWRKFGENGPLLEFMYFLNHEITLRDKLNKQLNSFIKAGTDSWVHFLYLASLTGSCGLPAEISTLAAKTGCCDVVKLITLLDKEMLFRPSGDNLTVSPLHPVRAQIIAELLETKVYREREQLLLEACACAVGDFTPILVPYLKCSSFTAEGYRSFVELAASSWSSCAQALRLMLWKDASVTFESMHSIRNEARLLHVPLTYIALTAAAYRSSRQKDDVEMIIRSITDESLQKQVQQLVLDFAYTFRISFEAYKLLEHIENKLPPVDTIMLAPSEAAFVLYMIADDPQCSTLRPEIVDRLKMLDVQTCNDVEGMIDLVFALKLHDVELAEQQRDYVLNELFGRYGVVAVRSQIAHSNGVFDNSCETLYAYLLPGYVVGKDAYASDHSDLSKDLSRVVYDMRRYFPHCHKYCVEYIGLEELLPELSDVSVSKAVSADLLVPAWSTIYNRFLFEMCHYGDCPHEDWESLEKHLRDTLATVFVAIERMVEFSRLVYSCQSSDVRSMIDELMDAVVSARRALSSVQLVVPRSERDPLSFQFSLAGVGVGVGMELGVQHGNFASVPALLAEPRRSLGLDRLDRLFANLRSLVDEGSYVFRAILGDRAVWSDRPLRALSIVCSLIDGCNDDFLRVFGDVQFVSNRQRHVLFELSAFWNHFYEVLHSSFGSSLDENIRLMASLKVFRRRFIEHLRRLEGVLDIKLDHLGHLELCVDESMVAEGVDFLYPTVRELVPSSYGSADAVYVNDFINFCGISTIVVIVKAGVRQLAVIECEFSELLSGAFPALLRPVVNPPSKVYFKGVVPSLVDARCALINDFAFCRRWLACLGVGFAFMSGEGVQRMTFDLSIFRRWVVKVCGDLSSIFDSAQSLFDTYPSLLVEFGDEYREFLRLVDRARKIV